MTIMAMTMMTVTMFVPRVLTPTLTAWVPASMAVWARGTRRASW